MLERPQITIGVESALYKYIHVKCKCNNFSKLKVKFLIRFGIRFALSAFIL